VRNDENHPVAFGDTPPKEGKKLNFIDAAVKQTMEKSEQNGGFFIIYILWEIFPKKICKFLDIVFD